MTDHPRDRFDLIPDAAAEAGQPFASDDIVVSIEALDGRKACLLANHGMIVCDTTMQRALSLAVEVEAL